ncbi:DUF2059 domain-containing protein [Labrys wisconsinensis]|uniref:DUF2059 domain-containing protein n=1 Tax=Labrys wisconsinensis TaxID=425677 RepID=A0ABU0JAB7_9HYPH|nr:DUF2059 domain-containing protein [Labrys wisconsinensis]MDQ0471198.1 hypothetical protein [Labrys wisconsinensis]
MRILGTALLSLILAGGGGAARADEQSRLALAREAVQASHATDNMRRVFPTILAQLKPLLLKQGGTEKSIDDFNTRILAKMDPQLDKLTDLAAQIYAREFSDEDLQNLVAFYHSPSGQHLIAKQPEIAQFMTTVGAQWGREMAQSVMDDYRKEQAARTAQP